MFQQRVECIFHDSKIIVQCEDLKETLENISSRSPLTRGVYLGAKIIYPLIELTNNREEFLQGVKFIHNQILEIQEQFNLDYGMNIEIGNGIINVPELIRVICRDSKNIDEFIDKFSLQINWFGENPDLPILSHQISGHWSVSVDEKDRIYLKGPFFYREHIKIGESNVVLDGDMALIYLCNNFKSYFSGHKIGEEIVARTFIIANEIAKALDLNLKWAIAYYVKGDDDLRMEDYTGVYFEETERFSKLNELFGRSGFEYYHIPNRGTSSEEESDVIHKVEREYIPEEGGFWMSPLTEGVTYF